MTKDDLQHALEALPTIQAALTAELAALDAPPPPPSAGQALLTAEDFEYVRQFKMPPETYDWHTGQLLDANGNLQTRWSYAPARIAGHYVDGQLRLALTMSIADNWREPIAEITDPGIDGAQATLVANWGDVYQDRRQCYQPYSLRTGGLRFFTGTDGLEYLAVTFYDSYDVAAKWNPSLMVCRLKADGTVDTWGPWRTSVRSHQSCGFLVSLPPAAQAIFGGSVLAVGAPQTAGDSLSPWGGSLLALPAFDLNAPPDPIGPPSDNDSLPKSIAVQVGLLQTLQHPLFVNPQYTNCRWNVPYDNSQGGVLSPPAAGIDDEGGRQQSFDGCVWIDTPTKRGVLFVGQAVMPHPDNAADPAKWPHAWYGPSPCPHGRVDPMSNSKGNHADQIMPIWAIYDPVDIERVAAGDMPPYAPQPTITNMLKVYQPAGVRGQTGIPPGYSSYHGGAWFDDRTKLLYIACAHEDGTRPVIRVFRLKA